MVFLQGSGSPCSSSSKRPGLTPAAGRGGRGGHWADGDPVPGREATWWAAASAPLATRSLSPCPPPQIPGELEVRAEQKKKGWVLVSRCPTLSYPASLFPTPLPSFPPCFPPSPGFAPGLLPCAVPLPSLAWGWQCTVLRGAVFSETAGDVVCVKLALPC